MATQKDIAKHLGVSVATVSYVLTGRGSVGEELRQRVLDAAKELGYKPNRQAQAMRTGKTRCIGLVIPDLTNPFFPELAQKIESQARRRGFSVIMVDCENKLENELEGLHLLEQQAVDGIVWCPSDPHILERLAHIDCPVVLTDRAHSEFNSVHCDYEKGGKLLADYIESLGHSKIGMVHGPLSSYSAMQRLNGFTKACSSNVEIVWRCENDYSSQLSDETKRHLINNDVSLIVAVNDLVAISLIDQLHQLGIKVPDDVSVVGFDNIPWSALITPKLTTVWQPVSAIAEEAMKILVSQIEEPNSTSTTAVVDVELVERGSAIKCS